MSGAPQRSLDFSHQTAEAKLVNNFVNADNRPVPEIKNLRGASVTSRHSANPNFGS